MKTSDESREDSWRRVVATLEDRAAVTKSPVAVALAYLVRDLGRDGDTAHTFRIDLANGGLLISTSATASATITECCISVEPERLAGGLPLFHVNYRARPDGRQLRHYFCNEYELPNVVRVQMQRLRNRPVP